MTRSKIDDLVALARGRHLVRPKDLKDLGIPRNYLGRLVQRGLLHRVERGLYASNSARVTENQSLIELSRKVPKAVICLLSALRFHGLTTQNPSEVWIAIDVKGWAPRFNYRSVRVMRFSGEALTFGIRDHILHGEKVRVFTPAKTVADCFKFRNKIGIDVAVEALRDCYRQKKATVDEISAAARVCRVANVMRPYLETLS